MRSLIVVHKRIVRLLCVAACTWAIAACSPTYNWRVQALDDVAADALLPCKPEAAERLVPLATPPVTLHVRACDVKGQTFAISWALLPVGADPILALQRWQQAAAAAVKAGPIAGAPTPWRVAGSDEGIRLLSQGQRHNGDTIATEWRYARRGQAVIQLAIYGGVDQPERMTQFWESLAWRKRP